MTMEQPARHLVRSSVDGKYVAVIATTSHEHCMIEVATGHVSSFVLERNVLAVVWHTGSERYPHAASYVCLLTEGGVVIILDASSTCRGADITCVAVLDCGQLIRELLAAECAKAAASGGCVNLVAAPQLLSAVCRTTTAGASSPPVVSPEADLVSMCFTHETFGLPTMLLLVSRRGDVYSVKLDDATMQPAPDALTAARFSKEDGLYLRMMDGSPMKQSRARCAMPGRAPNTAPLCVHHIIRPKAEHSNAEGEAVTLTCTMVDQHEGVFVIAVLRSSGVLRLYRVVESDLLVVDGRQHSFFAQLPLSSEPIALGKGVRRLQECISVHQDGPLQLFRFPNDHAVLVSIPVFVQSAWQYITKLNEQGDAVSTLPPVSLVRRDIPPPLALRLPLQLDGYSVALSLTRLVVFPEAIRRNVIPVETTTTAAETIGLSNSAPRKKELSSLQLPVLSLRVDVLLKSALYGTSVDLVPTGVRAASESTIAALMQRLCEAHALVLRELPTLPSDDAWEALASSSDPLRELTEMAERASLSIAVDVEKEYLRLCALGETVQHAETDLATRLTSLQQRVSSTTNRVQQLRDFLEDATIARKGTEPVHDLNEKLEKIHQALRRMEQELQLEPLNTKP